MNIQTDISTLQALITNITSEITGYNAQLQALTDATTVLQTLASIQTVLADGTGTDNQISEITALINSQN